MPELIEERRLITIIFADLSGFTALSSKLDPEEVKDIVNISFEHLNQPIVKHGGTIHKYEGDLVMALFGYPVAHEDDPERAIKASLAMLELLPEINRIISSKLMTKTDLGLHVGINSGVVFIGKVGTRDRSEYTVMGDVVNIASRLKDIARRGEIIVSDAVFKASRYLFEYEARPLTPVKGIDKPVRIFAPLGLKKKPDPKRGIEGLYSPLVGRDKEFGLLRDTIENLIDGKGGVCYVLGDAGLGKSRLLEELRAHIADRRLPVTQLAGRGLSYGEAMPYRPIIQILEDWLEVTDKDSRKVFEEKLVKKTKMIFPDDWAEIIPYLGYLFSIRFAGEFDEKIKFLDAKDLKVQIMVTLKKLLFGLARFRPVLLIIDDYHWIDNESLELLEFIFSPVAGETAGLPPILFLALARIDKKALPYKIKERLKQVRSGSYHEMVIKPLDGDSCTRLVDNLLKVTGITQAFRDRFLARAEGNPFYVEEIIRSMIDSGILVFRDGVWSMSRDVEAIKIPDTVQAVIAARLDMLTRDVRDVLQLAAVVGRNFHVPVLEQLCQIDSSILTVHLATLEEYEYITEQRLQPEAEYSFKHPLFQEVAYTSLLIKRRKELHGKAGALIERIYHERLEEFTNLLAHQYSNSDNPVKALEWLKKAGLRAKAQYANDEAIKYFQKAILVIKEGLDSAVQELPQLYEHIGDIYSLKCEYDRAREHYEEMSNTAVSDKIVQARSKKKISKIYYNQHRHDDALTILDETEKLLVGNSEDVMMEKAEIYASRADISSVKGEIEKAIDESNKALAIIDQVKTISSKTIKRAKIHCLTALGMAYDLKGDITKAIESYNKAMELAEETDDRKVLGTISNNLANIYGDISEYDRALELYQKYLAISSAIGYKRGIGMAHCNIGTIHNDRDNYEAALEFLHKGLQVAEELKDIYLMSAVQNLIGAVYITKGEVSKSREFLLKSLKVIEKEGNVEIIIAGYLNLVVADLAEIKEGIISKETYKYAKKALKLAEKMDLKTQRARCHLIYSRIYLASGDLKQAEENCQKAMTFFEESNLQKLLAESYCEYAKILQKQAAAGMMPGHSAPEYFNKALKIYKELKLNKNIKEIEALL